MEKVILTLTTVPDRLNITKEGWGPKPSIERLLKLSYPNYEVHFNIPYFNKKTGQQYIIPEWLKTLEKEDEKLKIFRTDDYGPATKLVPTLMRFDEDEDITIISVEDDLVYMDGFIQYHLETRLKYPESIFGFAGISAFNNKCHLCTTCEEDTDVRMLESYKTISYKRNFFKSDFFSDFVGKTWNDDVLISAYFGKHNRNKIVLRYSGDTDFRARVESFPIELVIPNNNSGCFLYRTESVSDNYDYFDKLGYFSKKINPSKTTVVTGLWDFTDGELDINGQIKYNNNLENIKKLLEVNLNLIIFGDEKTEKLVWEHRSKQNTQFILRNLNWFKNEFFEKIQNIRINEDWVKQNETLKDSDSFKYEMFNPVHLSKIFLLNDSKILNVFNSEHFYWVDPKITELENFDRGKFETFITTISKENNKFIFSSEENKETKNHCGFPKEKIDHFSETKIDTVGTNLFFGGPINTITDMNFIYYNSLSDTLSQGFMGTEESLFTIIIHKYSKIVNYIKISQNKNFDELISNLEIKNHNFENNKIFETSVFYYHGFDDFKILSEISKKLTSDYVTENFLVSKLSDIDTNEKEKLFENTNFKFLELNDDELTDYKKIIDEHFKSLNKDYMFSIDVIKK